MTAVAAIRFECNICMQVNSGGFQKCKSNFCAFKGGKGSKVKRIRQFCMDCVASSDKVRECKGEITNFELRKCEFHPFRFGKNPSRPKRKGNSEVLRKYQFVKKARPEASFGV